MHSLQQYLSGSAFRLWPAMLALTSGLCIYTFNILGFDFSFFPGDLGDARLNMYFLEHNFRFFTGQIESYWSAPFMYPEPEVMSFSDTLLGTAPIYAFFRLFGFDVYTSFQLWFALLSALNFISAYCFLQYTFKSRYVAAVGAFVFAFSIGILSQMYHAQTFARFAIPVALLMAVKFKEELHPKYFFLTLFLVVYQIYCGVYLGFILAIPVGILLMMLILKGCKERHPVLKRRGWYLFTLLSVFANLLFLWPLMSQYVKRAIHPTLEHYAGIIDTIPSIRSYFYSNSGSIPWEFLSEIENQVRFGGQHQLFPGGIAIFCMILSILWVVCRLFRSKWKADSFTTPVLLIITGLLTFVLFLRIDDVSAYLALYYIPGFTSMRALTRVINVQLVFFAVAVSFVFAAVLNKTVKNRAIVFLLAMGILVLDNSFFADGAFRWSKSEAEARVSILDDVLGNIPNGSIFSYEPVEQKDPAIHYQLDAMLAAQKHNLKTVNGYTATAPEKFAFFWHDPTESNRNFWLSDGELQLDLLYVVYGPSSVHTVSNEEIRSAMSDSLKYEYAVRQMVRAIKASNDWMEGIRERATTHPLSVDSLVVLDAIWALDNQAE